MVCLGEGFLGRGLVADLPVEAEIARHVVMELQSALGQGLGHLSDCRQVLVIDLDQLRGIFRLGQGLSDHYGDLLADVGHAVRGQRRNCGRFVWFTVFLGDHPPADRTADAIGREVCGDEDADHPRGGFRLADVDAVNLGMSIGRVQEAGIGLTRPINVVGVAAFAC